MFLLSQSPPFLNRKLICYCSYIVHLYQLSPFILIIAYYGLQYSLESLFLIVFNLIRLQYDCTDYKYWVVLIEEILKFR